MEFSQARLPRQIYYLLLFVIFQNGACAKRPDTSGENVWPAFWITDPSSRGNPYQILHFRKDFVLAAIPEHLWVDVSADSNYRLFVNGVSQISGPQRGDQYSWHYDTIDIASLLRQGENTICATVWTYGDDRPYSTISYKTAFIFHSEPGSALQLDTNKSWRVLRDLSYQPIPFDKKTLSTFYAAPPGDWVDFRLYPWAWNERDGKNLHWSEPLLLDPGIAGPIGTEVDWQLSPRTVAVPSEAYGPIYKIRRASAGLVIGKQNEEQLQLNVPAHYHGKILLDAQTIINAFPNIRLTGGRDATLNLSYSESLYDTRIEKGNRDEIEGKSVLGISDRVIADGQIEHGFRPLAYRTFRYFEIDAETAEAPLTVMIDRPSLTSYPFQTTAQFESSSSLLNKIWSTAERTARLCAYDTYMDCPYFERLQYVGDTRIQSLITLYLFDDDRLIKNALRQFDGSRTSFGLTQSRYPSEPSQIIPTYSLILINLVHDYWMHRSDDDFIKELVPGMLLINKWFEDRIDAETGMLGKLDYWNFVDWTAEWPWRSPLHPGGEPLSAKSGQSAYISLQYVYSLRDLIEILRYYHYDQEAEHLSKLSHSIIGSVQKTCWSNEQQLFSDSPDKTQFSQHTNSMAILAGAIEGSQAKQLMRRVLFSGGLIQASLYFQFYIFEAADRAGLGDEYSRAMNPWAEMLRKGLTTFAERSDPTRSDCHAWSASPAFGLLATVAGIRSASPGFRSVVIKPQLGLLQSLHCQISHPQGLLRVDLEIQADGSLNAVIEMPVPGKFVWGSQAVAISAGTTRLHLTS